MMSKLDIPIDQGEEGMIAANADIVTGLDFGTALAHNDAACCHQLSIEAFYAEHLRLAVASIARAAYTFFMCHVLVLPFIFSILVGLLYAAAASGLLLFPGLFSGCCFRRLGLALSNGSLGGRLSFKSVLLLSLLEYGSFARHQALASRNDVVDGKDREFLAMTPAVPVAFLGFVLEDNQFLAASVLNSSCQYQRLSYQRRTNHRGVRIRDKQHLVKLYLLTHFDCQ